MQRRALASTMSMFLTALFVLAPMGTVLALQSGGGGTASGNATSLDGGLPPGLDGLLALYQNGMSGLGIPTTFLLGDSPERAIAVGDLNGDGTADVAVSEAGSDKVWILLGDGAGGFGIPTRLPSGSRQSVVAVGDFNGDGINDQAVAEQFAAGVKFLFGDGLGGFRATEPSGESRLGAALVADLDGDGNADLALADDVSTYVTILLGDEQGQIRSTTIITVGVAPTAIATGDLNGDGLADLAVANNDSGDVAILLGDGAGGFGAATRFAAGSWPSALVVGDLNGDGIADLVAADGLADYVSVLLGDGTGSFGTPIGLAVSPSGPDADASTDSSGKGSGHDDSDVSSSATSSSAEVYQGVAALTLNPTTITGGTGGTSTGTVTLNAPAPAGGVVVTLTSSNVELAATVPSITIPAGAPQGTFIIATNERYRKYSGLAFSATITATHAATASATLNITAQPRPADFTNPNTAADPSPWQGLICGRSFVLQGGGSPEILYSCSLPNDGTFGTCTFQQECSLGCKVGPASGFTRQDFCPSTGPNPVAVTRNYIVSGDRVPATLVTEAPVGTNLTQGLPGTISNQLLNGVAFPGAINGVSANASHFPHEGGLTIPMGASSVGFDVATSYVPVTTFVDVVGDWNNNAGGRSGHAWIAMASPNPPPALPIPTLGDFKITGLNPVTGGQSSIGQIDISGITSGGGPTITLTSSHPAIASVPATFFMPASSVLGQQVSITTQPPAVDTNVTLTGTDGRYTFSAILTVLAPPPPPVLSAVSVNPTSVVGGNPATGTVTLSAAQSGPTVVQVSIIDTAPATLPTNDPPCPPSSRCHNVTVPAGATSANFAIATSAVTEQFNLNIFAGHAGTSRQTLLLITPGSAPTPTLSAVSVNPTSVVGGNSSTGTVILSAAAPSGGAVVSLSDNSTAATVPASVTVPAGATSANFTVTTTVVTASTTATISAVLAGVTRTAVLTVAPPPVPAAPTLISPAHDATVAQPITFDWSDVANATGYEIQVDNSQTISPPFVASQTVTASQVTLSGLPAQRLWWRVRAQNTAGVFGPFSATRRFTAQAAPAAATLSSVSVNPTSVVGPTSATGTATLTAAAPTGGAVVTLSSSNTAVATVLASVTVPAGATSATFTVTTTAVSTSTAVTLTGAYSGTSRTATLTVTPAPPPASLSTLTLNPTSVTGGSTSQGTVTLTNTAPTGGAVVSFSSSNPAVATGPASVTVSAGATSATFTVTTSAVTTSTAVSISGTYGGSTRSATLTVTPPAANVTLTVTATGRSGERVLSSPAGINVLVGSTGSASFATNTSIILSATNNRDVTWSGACSSGGNKTKTCTLTITGNASVTGNVQ